MRHLAASILAAVLALPACTSLDNADLDTAEEAIINGRESYPNQQPWMVRIDKDESLKCGGSLLHPSWVVTSAMCLEGTPTSSLRLVFGDHNRTVAEPTEQVRTVRRTIVHPEWNALAPYGHNIALIELSSPVRITAFVQTVALPTSRTPRGTVVGWGDTGPGSGNADRLREASLGILPIAQCGGLNNVCATEPDGGAFRTPCFGDYGGPLLNEGGVRRELLGVFAFTWPGNCHNAPEKDYVSVYTDVAHYAPWIAEATGARFRGDVRMTFGSRRTTGTVGLGCTSTGQSRRGPTNVDGTEISLDCPDADVVASCALTSDAEISELVRTVDGVATLVAVGGRFQSDRFRVPAGSVVAWTCFIDE